MLLAFDATFGIGTGILLFCFKCYLTDKFVYEFYCNFKCRWSMDIFVYVLVFVIWSHLSFLRFCYTFV